MHNRKTSISLKRKKIYQKEKRHSSVFGKAFQISRNYFSCDIHLMTNKLTKYQSQHLNINLITKYLCLKKLMLLTLKATIDWGAQYHSHQNFTNYQNWTNLVYQCDLQSHSVGPVHISCQHTWLVTIQQPLTGKSQCKLQSMEKFIEAIKTSQIPDDYKLVKSLFTSIPLQLALPQSIIRLLLPTEDSI